MLGVGVKLSFSSIPFPQNAPLHPLAYYAPSAAGLREGVLLISLAGSSVHRAEASSGFCWKSAWNNRQEQACSCWRGAWRGHSLPQVRHRCNRPVIRHQFTTLNKIQAGMLAHMVKPYLESYLQDISQYAYVSGRSALCRVFSHLYKVRQNAPTKEAMVQRRQQGVPRTECSGGITFSLDVAKAFDTIPRWVIKSACEDAQIPPDVIQHITAIHEQRT